jgi:hypothetical protein
VLFTGRIQIDVMTFKQALQPIRPRVAADGYVEQHRRGWIEAVAAAKKNLA